ncbi:MAG TPA: LacI family DNA-binding transcriptional regulator [Rugosimonospora sp.]|nr:LacI family DNA-binding transcriptional regulator [Rugosimonospora sp.]
MRRATIADIARAAGVSKGAVSYALNGRPGVSEATRRRILAIAAEYGWHPSSAARALSDGRAGVLGLVVDRPARTLGIESFFMQLISGIESTLSARSVGLLLQVTADQHDEMEAYRRWWAQRRVDGVILVDLHREDPRVALLEELRMPAVVVGGPEGLGSLPGVWSDDAGAMTAVVDYLAALGHRRIARVAGLAELCHTAVRSRALAAAATRLGLTDVVTINTDYTGDEGARATRALLSRRPAPTAIIYDNDVMAVAGVAVAHEMRVAIPAEVSVVAWDDSPLCQLVHPQLSAVSRDIVAYGAHAAACLLEVVSGAEVGSFQDEAPRLVPRGSTAAPTP